jgi:hypothetical protein
MNHTLKRIITFIGGMAFGLTLFTGAASAAPRDEHGPPAHASTTKSTQADEWSSKDHDCNGTHHSDTGHGANDASTPHVYSETCDEEVASGNGQPSDSDPSGRPCAGCVGNADDKNPPGQGPDAQHDGNNGYECDRKGDVDGGNNGIAWGNPAHTGCLNESTEQEEVPPVDEIGNTPNNPNPPVVLHDVVEKPNPPCAEGDMAVDVNNDGVLDGKDCVPVCAEGPMTTDVNGDGRLDGADCALAGLPAATAVLGVSYERAAEVPPAEVLGVSLERADVAPATLARTGALVDPAGLLLTGLSLVAFGAMLVVTKRRSVGTTC